LIDNLTKTASFIAKYLSKSSFGNPDYQPGGLKKLDSVFENSDII